MRVSKEQKLPPPPPKKSDFPWLLFLFVLFWSCFVYYSITPDLPTLSSPIKFYSNQCRQDLNATLLSAIRNANQSIHLVMFGLTDKSILKALQEKTEEKVPIKIFYDYGGSRKIYQYLKNTELHPIQTSALMHQKVLIIDEEMVFIGSANMTKASLRMHDNLVIGLSSRTLARFLKEHEPFKPGYFRTHVGGQEIELWLLPDPRGHALTELRKQLWNAKSKIQVALFTFTHKGLVYDLIDAKKRGVDVTCIIDSQSGFGSSRKTIEALKKEGVNVYLSKGEQLMHHKFVLIDDEKLFTGSANWTKSALYKNSDLLIALHKLNAPQKKYMQNLWASIDRTKVFE